MERLSYLFLKIIQQCIIIFRFADFKKIELLTILLLIFYLGSFSNHTKKVKKADFNPFFQEYETPFGIPPFDLIKPEHFLPAIEEGMFREKAELERIINNLENPTFENTIVAFSEMGSFLDHVTTVFFNLNSANTNDELKKIAKQITPMLSIHDDEINLNPKLFERIKFVYEQRNSQNLVPDQLYLLTNLYNSFIKNGAILTEKDKEELKEINQHISLLNIQFSQNLLAETNDFKLKIEDEKNLTGLPESVISSGSNTAKQFDLNGNWVYTLHASSMYPFLAYSENRELREKLYTAYILRGNNDNSYDNKKIASEIVKLRIRKANILGFNSYADLVLSDRMAKNANTVNHFLMNIWYHAIEIAKQEVKEMQAMIDAEGGNFKLAPWDWWYYANKISQSKYELDENQLRSYFELNNVLKGVFYVANQLFGITFTEIKDIPKPHTNALAFNVKEATGKHIGILFMDFHARTNKRGGAWCGNYRPYKIKNGKETQPVVTMVCNFTNPSDDKPALLSLSEVRTLFHEFGHALDLLFSNIRYQTSFYSIDFMEFPAQIMSHWAFEPEVFEVYAKHYKTGETIPKEFIEKTQKASLFNQGFVNVEYLAAAFLDMAYHSQTTITNINIEQFENEFFSKIGLIPEISSRYRSTYFNHIFSGAYAAGYYSYIWSGILDNDGFEAFRENGLFDLHTAKLYRENVLEPNGLMDPMEMYIKFRGKEPNIEPLLRSRGLIK